MAHPAKSVELSGGCDASRYGVLDFTHIPDMHEDLRPAFAMDNRPPLQTQGRLGAALLARSRRPED